MKSASFEIFAGWCALLTGIFGILYSVSFVIVRPAFPTVGAILSAFFLTLAGLFTLPAMTAVYSRLRGWAQEFSLWAFMLGFAGAIGSTVHGAYDLANAINPTPAVVSLTDENLPSQVDPRGFMTFLVVGLAILSFSWLIARSKRLPRGLGYLGYALAVLMIVLYFERLIFPASGSLLILVPAIITGFLVTPIWYIWLALAIWRNVSRMGD